MKKATRFEVKTEGIETLIVLFDKDSKIIEGESLWEGNFDCSHNKLTSLEGSPSSVEGYFDCSDNNLTSLEGSPSSFKGDFYCYNNNLTSLKGSPSSVEGNFYCSNNNLTSFPEELYEKFTMKLANNPFEVDPRNKKVVKILTDKKWDFVILENNLLSQNI